MLHFINALVCHNSHTSHYSSISYHSVTGRPNPELVKLVSMSSGGGFFDTGERYGSHSKTAMGMGWGETECLVSKLIQEAADIDNMDIEKPVVATKFTPSPWRTTVESVVEACEESRKRLGVESIDLYQIQMPDVVKVRRRHLKTCCFEQYISIEK